MWCSPTGVSRRTTAVGLTGTQTCESFAGTVVQTVHRNAVGNPIIFKMVTTFTAQGLI